MAASFHTHSGSNSSKKNGWKAKAKVSMVEECSGADSFWRFICMIYDSWAFLPSGLRVHHLLWSVKRSGVRFFFCETCEGSSDMFMSLACCASADHCFFWSISCHQNAVNDGKRKKRASRMRCNLIGSSSRSKLEWTNMTVGFFTHSNSAEERMSKLGGTKVYF